MSYKKSSTASWANGKVADLLPKSHHVFVPLARAQALARGEILTPAQVRETGSARTVRDGVPVVQTFYKTRVLANPIGSYNHVGYGRIPLPSAVFLTVRMQLGSSQFINLLNPADPDVYRLMHAWNNAKTMGVSLFDGDRALLCYAPFELSPRIDATLNECRGDSTYLRRFQRELSEMIGCGALLATATSDIPGIAKLKEVQLALIATAHTTPGRDALDECR